MLLQCDDSGIVSLYKYFCLMNIDSACGDEAFYVLCFLALINLAYYSKFVLGLSRLLHG